MKKSLLLLFMALFLYSNQVSADTWDYNVDVFVGYKKLNSTDWGPIDDQFYFGTNFYTKPRKSLFGFNASYTTSVGAKSEGTLDYSGFVSQLDLGGHFQYKIQRFRFLANGGISFALADMTVENSTVSVTDSTVGVGLYTNAEFQFIISDLLHTGIKAGASYIEADLNGNNIDVGGISIGLTFGFKF